MPYIPLRKDFVFDVKCHVCPRALTSNVAIILCDNQGREYPYGPTCVRKELDKDGLAKLKSIPDFTKAAPGEEHEGRKTGGGGPGGAGYPDNQVARMRRAVTYLLLRQERLAHISGATYEPLAAYADDYGQRRMLSGGAISHVLNIARKCADGKYGFDNLQTVYAYDRCIDRILQATPPAKQEWLNDVQASLRRNLYLSEKQAQGVENWFSNIPGHQPLNPIGFSWAWRSQ